MIFSEDGIDEKGGGHAETETVAKIIEFLAEAVGPADQFRDGTVDGIEKIGDKNGVGRPEKVPLKTEDDRNKTAGEVEKRSDILELDHGGAELTLFRRGCQ